MHGAIEQLPKGLTTVIKVHGGRVKFYLSWHVHN